MITLHFHLQPQYKYESFHIYFRKEKLRENVSFYQSIDAPDFVLLFFFFLSFETVIDYNVPFVNFPESVILPNNRSARDHSSFVDEAFAGVVLKVQAVLSRLLNVILGNVREMTKDYDAILEEAADTTARQLANTQQPPTTSQAPENTEQKHCDLASCAPKQWQLSAQTKEMEASGLNSSISSPFCDALPEFDSLCQGPEFPPVEEPTCGPYSPAYTDAVFQALDLGGPEYSNVDADIMKGFKELICQYSTAFVLPGSPLRAVKGFEHRIDTADAPPIYSHPYKKSP